MTDMQVRSDEARRNLRHLLDQVARDYHITILRYDKPVAVLVPVDWYEDAEDAWGARLEQDAGSKEFIAEARRIGPELRARSSDLDRHAGWLLKELADRLDGQAAAHATEDNHG